MSRKIVSQTNDYTTSFPSLNLPMAKYLEEDETVYGVKLAVGDTDPRYPSDSDLESVELIDIDGRVYHSVHKNYTSEMLTPTEDNDYVIETELDGNFTYTVLQHNTSIANKYKKDFNIVEVLGLPEYDEETHKTDLILEASVSKEQRAAAEKYEADRAKKLEEDAALQDKPSDEEIAALADSLAGISSGQLSIETVINNN
jgi:hypothetical protein